MSFTIQKLKCSEPTCKKVVDVVTGNFLITQDQRNVDRACPKHRQKFLDILRKNEAFVAMVNRSNR
jgi:hypothetical protein